MYYKITNKDSKVYKQLYNLRKKEQEIEESNKKLVKELIGQDFTYFIGKAGQQNFHRVTQYSGFEFKHPEKLPPKVWVLDKQYGDKGGYVPNRRTKAGREMLEKLRTLPHSSIIDVFRILKCELSGRFAFPYVEICKDDVIVLYMSERYDDVLSKNKDIIEITKREFEELNK